MGPFFEKKDENREIRRGTGSSAISSVISFRSEIEWPIWPEGSGEISDREQECLGKDSAQTRDE
jgi:hypothetical protein